ncbi:MAG: Tryptophan--tRNA ligase [bacterium ADurb.Bin400]|nr:MAG: Tryptophan--tRNA ligase [bacterium ADurb.Bin400]
MSTKRRIFSGVQPTGNLHIGNYLGAIKQWVSLQDQVDEAIFCVVDLHAITTPQDPAELRRNILSIAATYLAAGIDPEKSIIFVQSDRPEHSELMWVLTCQTRLGELMRMTQLKDKMDRAIKEVFPGTDDATISKLREQFLSEGAHRDIPAGLLAYPVLMAADILLYNTTHVPVGEDQKQHIELTRDLAIRFNNRYGETFVVPEPMIKKSTARIMGLDDPLKKMSKSAMSPNNYIAMTDDADTIRKKVMRAVTDSGTEVVYSPEKPAIANLLNIFSEVSGRSISELEEVYGSAGYGKFKEALADALIQFLMPFQKKYSELLADEKQLKTVLQAGSKRVAPLASETLAKVQDKIGLGI